MSLPSGTDAAAARGMIFVSPDYRAKTSWMGPKAEADLLQILDKLKAEYRIGKTVLCGGSMGGSSALTFAARHPRLVDGVVAMNGTANHLEYGNFQEAIAESYGGPKTKIPAEYKKRSAEYWPERFTMPVGITTGGRDQSVPPSSVLRLAEVLKKIGRKVLVIHREDGTRQQVVVTLRIDTPIEVDYYRAGGILPFVLRQLLAGS